MAAKDAICYDHMPKLRSGFSLPAQGAWKWIPAAADAEFEIEDDEVSMLDAIPELRRLRGKE